ncbi:MAG: energy-coupling factor ABC transporter ATP-binding protein [Candidatus Edwardsbacteria bacterium]|nr:energy-coupling factor ABC transporter ATP-binding protein [Candidatus Edwardsbacteria bacterium]MBU1576033.1 energy-coupling factor ABC transporter ATP-binding protein [Candidatus Edwardsbacteria bacterium]MBU2463056.1 energy-coupling factor ABC transporter ATP-binding protein [Candidatus Edwardsbacteria bacterium]MBU2594308.1 energy-coupling factor ABC transporter ATP-binding protein [Candidatus Edwardsbacteria bacterium]
MSHHITEARDLFYSYPDGHQAVNGISFRIHHGESVGVIGANGAGKSTLLMLLTGILRPAKGEVVIGEVRLTKDTLNMIRQRLGMVFQNPDDQLFMTTVHDDVAFGPRNLKIDEPQVEQRVVSALEQVGILHLKDRAPFHLSAGEKRAAAIATVLSMTPDILILDEPTSSLDPKSRRRLMNILSSFEHTKIITSHDLDMVLELCKRTIIIKEGRIISDGPTKDILTDRKLMEEAGLEIPLSLQNCPVCGGGK